MRIKVRMGRARHAFIAPDVVDSPAHEDYLTVQHFRNLKDAATKRYPEVGDSVAFLHEKDMKHGKGTITVDYGVKFSSANDGTNDYRHIIVSRTGERHYVRPEHVACI